MARTCSTCALDPGTRSAAEYAVAEGQSIAAVARRYALSEDALGRHVRRHLAESIRSAAVESRRLDVGSIALRVTSIADDARAARTAAVADGRTLDAVRAGDAELRALHTMAERLGIDSGTTAELIAEARALTDAIGDVVYANPAAAAPIIAALRRRDAREVADGLAALAARAAATTPATFTALEA